MIVQIEKKMPCEEYLKLQITVVVVVVVVVPVCGLIPLN